MARTIDLGHIILTKLRGYRWEAVPARDEEGKPYVQLTEVYVVTDEDYSVAPEGQRRLPIEVTPAQQKALNNVFREKILAAAARESVDLDVEPPEEV